ncbi:MAG: GNAT family N-acetyltransferase [Patescibacteria group bacterium]|jgi:hypothetical protein
MTYVKVKCPSCEKQFAQEAKFRTHYTLEHSTEDHVDFEQLYIEHILHGISPVCGCGCVGKPRFDSWKKGYTSKFIRGHNASVDSVYLNPAKQAEFAQKRKEGFASGKFTSWNDGLTKETSEILAKAAEKTSKTFKRKLNEGFISWQTGLTKNSDDRVAYMTNSRNKKLSSGEISVWNKGLTKETDVRLKALSENHTKRLLENNSKRLTPKQFIERVNKQSTFTIVSDPSTYKNKYQRFDFKCNECGEISQKTLTMLMNSPVCYICHPTESKGQLEVYDFVKSLAADAILSDRNVISPKELDVYVPSAKFAIEYDGLYWHSETFVGKTHASEKVKACDVAGVRIMRVFEDEWRDKRKIVESMIKHRLGVNDVKVYARKCDVVELKPAARREFFESAHLEGDANSTVAFGLKYDGKLVAAISLRRPFHNRHAARLEIGRFALAPNYSVPGALSRLVNKCREFAIKNGKESLLTYVDRRVGTADGYIAAGFNVLNETGERFWWTDFTNRINRFAIRADKPNGITQQQRADEAGVVPLWGCKNLILELSAL